MSSRNQIIRLNRIEYVKNKNRRTNNKMYKNYQAKSFDKSSN